MKTIRSCFKLLIAVVALLFTSSCVTHKPGPANNITDIAKPVVTAGWITFKPEMEINPSTLFADHAAIFHLPPGNQMVVQSQETDELGLTHYRYQQLFRGLKVEHAEFLVRATNNHAISANGRLVYDFQPETTTPRLTEEQAWEIVRQRIPAQRYFRNDKLVDELTNPDAAVAGYRPPGELLFTEDTSTTDGARRLAWAFKVYVAPADNSRQIYINAADGTVVKELPLFPACYWGSGPVTFRGTRNINTQKKGDRYYLVDDCDGTLLSAVLWDSAQKAIAVSDDDNDWTGNNPSYYFAFDITLTIQSKPVRDWIWAGEDSS
jgi:Zn-dependent metalloprotease